MTYATFVVIGLLFVAAFVVPAPAVASDDWPPDVGDCINVSVTPPGAAVDPFCLVPHEPAPGP